MGKRRGILRRCITNEIQGADGRRGHTTSYTRLKGERVVVGHTLFFNAYRQLPSFRGPSILPLTLKQSSVVTDEGISLIWRERTFRNVSLFSLLAQVWGSWDWRNNGEKLMCTARRAGETTGLREDGTAPLHVLWSHRQRGSCPSWVLNLVIISRDIKVSPKRFFSCLMLKESSFDREQK